MFLVDSNIIIDVIGHHPRWAEPSAALLSACTEKGLLIINPVIYAEVSVPFPSMETCHEALTHMALHHEPIPEDAAFLAGKAFLRYRRAKGKKTSPLPDFFIGAHAGVRGYSLLTRDAKRYRNYFPRLNLIEP